MFNCSLYASMSSVEKKDSHLSLQQESKVRSPSLCCPQSSVLTESGKETSESELPGRGPPSSEFTGDGRLGVCGDEVITIEQKAYLAVSRLEFMTQKTSQWLA